MEKNNTFWWLALIVWMAGSTWWHVCKIKELCSTQAVSVLPAQPSHISPLRITDEHALQLESAGNFTFLKSDADAGFSAVQPEIDSLSKYLLAHPGKKLTITGFYAASETNSTPYPDLGIARAEFIKKYFIDKGHPKEQFITSSKLITQTEQPSDTLHGGIEFAFSKTIPSSANELATSQKYESVFKPLDLYFNTGSTRYIQTPDNKLFIEAAKKFLAENKEKHLMIRGYTDDVGDELNNQKLSEKRAQDVKRELVKAGIAVSQLKTEAKGEADPKESNATPEGRGANRRVSVLVAQ